MSSKVSRAVAATALIAGILAGTTVPAFAAKKAAAPAETAAPAPAPAPAEAAPPAAPADVAAPAVDTAAPAADAAAPVDGATPPEAGADAAAPGEAAPPAGLPGQVTEVENPYGLSALWAQGDFVSKGTLVAMIIMSMGTWYIMLTKLFEQSRLLRQAKVARKEFWTAGSITEGAKRLGDKSVFRSIVESGVRSAEHHDGALTDQIDLHTWVTMSLQRTVETTQSRLQEGLAFLATVGSTAPFVGLFGTVWGIYHALVAIGLSGQASIDKVAGPVGEALIMTAIGLAVAVPAVLGYNWLVRRNKACTDALRSFSADLHAVLLAQTHRSSHMARSA